MIPVSMSHGYLHGRPPDGGGHPGYQPIFMSINHGAAPQPVHQPPPVQAVNSVCQVGPMISQGGQVNPLSPGIQMLVPQHPIHYVTHSSASHHEPQLHQPPQDERSDLKLLSKRLSNRKSARVSRARKKAVEEELTRTNEEMKLHARLLKVLPDPILSVDKAGTIQYASPACATHFLAPETEMLGASIFKWVSRESRTLIQRHILDLFASCNDNSNSNTAPEPAQLWIHPQSIFNIKIKRQDGSSLKCSISSNLRCEPSEKDEKKEEPIEAILVLRPNERPKLRKKLQSNVLLRTSENINRTRLGAGPGVKRECPPAAAAAARPPLPPPPRPPLAGTPPRGPGRPAMPSPPPSASSRSRSRSPSSSPSPSPRKQPGGKRRRGELTPHHPALAALGLLGGVGGGGGGGGGAPAPGPGPMAVLGLGLDQRVPSLVAAVPMHPGLPAGWGPSAPAAAAPGDALAAAAAAAAAGRGKGERRRHPKGSSRRDRGPLQPPAGGEGAARRRPRPPAAASSSSSSSPPPSLSAGRRRGEGPSAATLEARLLSLLNGQALPAEEGRCSPPRREEPHPAAATAAAAPLSPPAAAPAAAAATVAASPLAEAEDLSSAVTSLFLLRHRQHPPGAG